MVTTASSVSLHDEEHRHASPTASTPPPDSRVTTGISAFPWGWPWEAQSSPRVARVKMKGQRQPGRESGEWTHVYAWLCT